MGREAKFSVLSTLSNTEIYPTVCGLIDIPILQAIQLFILLIAIKGILMYASYVV